MTAIIIVGSPVVLLLLYFLAKYCIKCYTARENLKALIDDGVKHAVVADNHIEFEQQVLQKVRIFFYRNIVQHTINL